MWSLGGGFGPNDFTYSDYAGEFWWDPLATDEAGEQGAYRWVRGGKRYAKGEFEREDPLVFRDGTPYPPPEDN